MRFIFVELEINVWITMYILGVRPKVELIAQTKRQAHT